MSNFQIIDTHTHFYDPSRPQDVPWPSKDDDFLYRTVLPEEYKTMTTSLGVRGTVVVEASKWFEDNLWVLELAETEPFIVGVVGNLQLDSVDFEPHFEQVTANPLFRGIRLGGGVVQHLSDGDLQKLERLAAADLQLDILGNADVLPSVAELATQIPSLRIVINHVGSACINGKTPDHEWAEAMQISAKPSNVYCKVSGLVEGVTDKTQPPPKEVAFYAPVLDLLWNQFGQERLIYGSNWPVSARYADYAFVQQLALDYFQRKGQDAMVKVFGQNSKAVYKWIDRLK